MPVRGRKSQAVSPLPLNNPMQSKVSKFVSLSDAKAGLVCSSAQPKFANLFLFIYYNSPHELMQACPDAVYDVT